MVTIITIYCIAVIVFSKIHYQNYYNPVTVLYIIWGILVPLSSLGLYGLYIPSNKTYSIILIGLIGYMLGISIGNHLVVRKAKYNKNYEKPSTQVVDSKVNYSFLYIISCISAVYFIYQGFVVLSLLASGRQLDYIRELSTASDYNELRSSIFIILIKNFIATPTVYMTIALLPIEILRGKRDKLLIILSLFNLVMWVITTAGRSVILWLALYLAVTYLFTRQSINKKKKKIKRKTKITLIILAFVLFIVLLQTTKSRKGSDVDLIRQMCVYFVAPINFLDLSINTIDMSYSSTYTYGLSSFYGVIYPILFISRYTGILSSYPPLTTTAYELGFTMLEQGRLVGDGFYMNAFATIFFQPYIDGRYFGVVVICAAFGLMCSIFYKKLVMYRDNKHLLLYMLLFQRIVFSFVRFYFIQPAQFVTLVFAMFAITCSKDAKEQNNQTI